MGKNDFLSPKAIANRIKASGSCGIHHRERYHVARAVVIRACLTACSARCVAHRVMSSSGNARAVERSPEAQMVL